MLPDSRNPGDVLLECSGFHLQDSSNLSMPITLLPNIANVAHAAGVVATES